jgi:hypothetical protein
MREAEPTEIEGQRVRVPVTPSWLGGARRFAARKRGAEAHCDGTCDALYPGTSLDRQGRCLLAEGHEGSHVYRARGPVRKPTRVRAYQAERDEKKRLARLARRRRRRERATMTL